jgi:cobalt/nickel transport system ATP-binding protein
VNGARLTVEGIRFAYPGADPSLHDVSFRVEPGERVAILGANGAGKSTLLLHLNGLLHPDAGRVTVDGTHATEENAHEIRTRVGLVFQDPDDQLFLPTLLDDVAFGPLNQGDDPRTAERAARRILDSLGLSHAAHRAAHHLSGGEKRLASLATALVLRPDVLALDEPTAALDARARRQVLDILHARDESLIIATHDIGLARDLCQRAIVLDTGRVVADADTHRILDDTALLLAHGLLDPGRGR